MTRRYDSDNLFSGLLRWGPGRTPLPYHRIKDRVYLEPCDGISIKELGGRAGIPYRPFEAAVLSRLSQVAPAELFAEAPCDLFDSLNAAFLELEGQDVEPARRFLTEWQTQGRPARGTWAGLQDLEERSPAGHAKIYQRLYLAFWSDVGQARASLASIRYLSPAMAEAREADPTALRDLLRREIASAVNSMHVTAEATGPYTRTIHVAICFRQAGEARLCYPLPDHPWPWWAAEVCDLDDATEETPRGERMTRLLQEAMHAAPTELLRAWLGRLLRAEEYGSEDVRRRPALARLRQELRQELEAAAAR